MKESRIDVFRGMPSVKREEGAPPAPKESPQKGEGQV